MFFKKKKNKNNFISKSKEIEDDSYEDEFDEVLRDAYYRSVDGLLRQRYEYCTNEVERNEILERINANIEAYKKEKDSQMKLRLKK